MNKTKLITTVLATSLVTTSCNLNPFLVKDDSIEYYADVGVDEDNLKANEVFDSEDGAQSTIYHKTIQLPDRKQTLRNDLTYVQYEQVIQLSQAYEDGNNFAGEVHPASFTDLTQHDSIVTVEGNDDLVVTNFQHVDGEQYSFFLKSFADDTISLSDTNLVIYFYDISGDTIGVWQPAFNEEDTLLEPGVSTEIIINVPPYNYVKYMSFTVSQQDYTEYPRNISTVFSTEKEIDYNNIDTYKIKD